MDTVTAISILRPERFRAACDTLAAKDRDLQIIIDTYGYPPFWSRPNTFETLVHIILEQQVSLASAKAALLKLQHAVGKVTPEALSRLSDQEFKSAYFSRQKMMYARDLSQHILNGSFRLETLEKLSDNDVRLELTKVKGIGNWTTDVYLMMVLHREDIFPVGDLAAVKALRQLKRIPKTVPKEELLEIVEQWAPMKTIATMLLWHNYLSIHTIKSTY